MSEVEEEIARIFGPEGILAQRLPTYEYRPGQLTMATAVAELLSAEPGLDGQARMLAVEAETGIGKTLAYLVPAILSGQKVVVSTATLNLQEQILKKEIPFIKKHLAPELTALCVKGRQNYLCRHRCTQLLSAPQLHLFGQSEELRLLQEWLHHTKTGDRAELPWLPDDSPLWHEISSSSSKCGGTQCPENSTCFLNHLRRQAGKARLLIVNHHLFFSDLAIRRDGHAELLPRYETVIFDEAHHLENIATKYFGTSFSHYQLLDLVKDIESQAQTGLGKKEGEKTVQIARALASQAGEFAAIFPQERGSFPLTDLLASPGWLPALAELQQALVSLVSQLQKLTLSQESWGNLQRRAEELQANLAIIAAGQSSGYVYWFERREKAISLTASPIDIAAELDRDLYRQVPRLVFTSATLTTGGNFSYFNNRMGLGPATRTLSLPSPFDYRLRTRLYIPANHFPPPQASDFSRQLQAQVHELLLASRGRALLLFTSISGMRAMYTYLSGRLPYPLLIQGEAPKHLLLEQFQEQTDSVLLAVASFWEGVNVPGETLSCVIIDKLPFEVPSDPVIMARINRITEEGGKPFFDFQIPRAILTLRQGVGRLMRAASDQGLLAIMDVRLFTKSYGRLFLRSLPPSPVLRDLEAVKHYFRDSK